MRKSLLLVALVLLFAALCLFSVGAEDKVAFLSSGATGDGSSADSPVGTLAGAYNALGTDGGTIVFMNTYPISSATDVPPHTGKVIWTGVYGGVDYRTTNTAALKWAGSYRVSMGGPTEIDNFVFIDAAAGGVLAANFNDLTIGSDVQILNASGAAAKTTALIGGPNVNSANCPHPAGKKCTVTVNSGSFNYIVAFSRNANASYASHEGTVTLNIGGTATAKACYLGANGTSAKGGTTVLNLSGNAAVSGTVYLSSYTGTAVSASNGSVTVNVTDSASIGAFLGYRTALFPNGTRTLNYAETATLPAGLVTPTHFDTITKIEPTVPDEPEEPIELEVVYVANGGTGNGATADAPVGTLEAAHALLPNGGTVVLVGETSVLVRTTLPAHSGTMTYTSVYDGVDYREDGARLYFPNGITVILGGEAIFKDIAIHTDTYTYISAGFHPLTFDTGVVTTHTEENLAKDSDEVNGLRVTGGYNTLTLGEVTDDRNATITLKSGFFRYVHGFSRFSGKTTYTGTANIVIEGTAIVDELICGATQNEATAANVNLTLSDDARIHNVFLGGQQKTNFLTGTFNFVVNGGDIYEIDALCLFTAVDCNSILTYDVNTVPDGLVMLAEVAQIKTIQTFCERDNTHKYSEPFASEFDASVMLKKCSICNDIQFVSELPEEISGNVVFVAEGGIGDGSHPSIPTSDLYAAFKKLETSGGTIVIINAYTLKTNTDQKIGTAPAFFQEPLHKGAITVTSVYGDVDYRENGAKIVFDGNVDYKLGGPVTFDHIVFDATEETTANTIAARYNPVVFGEDVVMLRDMDDAYSLDLIGGYNGFRYTDFTDVEIEDELLEMVNPARPLTINPETGDYTIDDPVFVEKEGVESDFFLRKDAAESINKMFADMYALGLKRPNWISYAWRGYYAQYDGYSKQVGNIRVNYPNYDFEMAHQAVLRSCSLPGSSEHHLGYAIDFHDADAAETNPHFAYDKTAEWAWIMQNAHKYGFILRFTSKDTATTGFIYEAWHFRYVDVEHATAIANLNSNGDPIANADMLLTPEWCLEDYVGLVTGMYGLDSSVTVNGGTFAHVEGGSRDCDDITFTGESTVTVGEKATVMPEGTTYDLIYFSADADGDGLSAASPIGTLTQAYAKLGNDGGTLVWMSELSVGAATELPAHEGTVTITSVYGNVDYRESGAALKYTGVIRVAFNGPTVLENFKIINNHGGDHLLCANFHPLTLGDGMVLVNKNGNEASTLIVIGGGNNNLSVGTLDAGETNTITVKSGTYKQIVGFSAYNTNLSHTGTVNLNIGGNVKVSSIIMGAKNTGSKGGSTVLTLTENASVGTVYLANGDNTAVMNGTVTVYAKDSSTIRAFNHYRPALFTTENARSLYYDETATLPKSLDTCFDNITLLGAVERTGDASGDGKVTLADVVRVLRASTEESVTVSMEADLNKDGAFTVIDALLILKKILNS